jgi:peptide/nickel transport system substrate-binding protein
MTPVIRAIAAVALLIAIFGSGTVLAQKRGGILTMHSPDSPASMSPLEEVTVFSLGPMMGVFNNLVMSDQHVKQASLEAMVPDLATSWSWNEDGTALTFPLRKGVRWHDGKPFTARDVKCTWDLVTDTGPEKLRVNPRKETWRNLDHVTTGGDHEVTFHLKRPQPALPMQIATIAIYPCHVSPREMRQHPIGTGPFKFVAFKPNEYVKVTRNPDYWKPDRPYLDGIEYTIIRDRSTAALAFVSGKLDMTFPNSLTAPLLRDVQNQAPQAICEMTPTGTNNHLLVNREKPPFDNLELRRAMALALDRKAFIDILSEGRGEIGGVMQPPPEGLWGMPSELLRKLPGYGPDVQENRAEARQIMEKLGYGPGNRLRIKVSARDIPISRDPAVILIDQLKEVYIDAELEAIDTTNWFPKLRRRDFTVGLNGQASGPYPDPALEAFYGCGSKLNWDGYCNAEVDRLIEQQSAEGDRERRKQLVWAIEKRLAEDFARPIIFYTRGGTCWHPWVKGLTLMVNSIFLGNRREDIWLDK